MRKSESSCLGFKAVCLLMHVWLVLASNRYPEWLRTSVAFLICVWHHRWIVYSLRWLVMRPMPVLRIGDGLNQVQISIEVRGFPVNFHRESVPIVNSIGLQWPLRLCRNSYVCSEPRTFQVTNSESFVKNLRHRSLNSAIGGSNDCNRTPQITNWTVRLKLN